MKIVSITMVKNESDIIESFVRYNLNIIDEMIILDNGSSDETLEILNQLKGENLPITILIDEDEYYEQSEKTNRLLHKAVYEHDADIICPLDADEFISSDIGHPKNIINTIEDETCFLVKWRTYIPLVDDEKRGNKFIPSKFTYIFDEKIEKYYKVILTRKLVENYNVELSVGNHHLIFDKEFKDKINYKKIDDLKIAHFPLRSKEQTVSKVLIGWPNMLSKVNVIKGHGIHWEAIYNRLIDKKEISDKDLIEFAKSYCFDTEEEIAISNKPLNFDFCKDLEIRYQYEYNFLKNIMDNYIFFAREINRFKNEDIEKNKCIADLNNEIKKKDEIIKNKENAIKELEEKLHEK